MRKNRFRTDFAESIFRAKYAQGPADTWDNLCDRLVNDVCGDRSLTAKPTTYSLMSKDEQGQLAQYMKEMKVIMGGRYLYYAGRPASFFNNCFVFIAEEDTREEWARIAEATTSALMSGGGIGVDYSILRPSGRTLSRTGGISSGPIPLMHIVNEIGRNVMQGGARRSAMFASLNWQHDDIQDFITAKNWTEEMKRIKAEQFDFPLPLDMTNISVNWDTDFIEKTHGMEYAATPREREILSKDIPDIWYQVVKQMCQTGEPGMCFNFYENEKDTGRNAYLNVCAFSW